MLVTSVADAAENATYVIVAVKPSDVASVVGEIAEAAAQAESDSAEQVFVTVAAGVTTEFYESKLPAGCAGDPGDAQRAGGGRRRGQRAGAGPVRDRRTAQGGVRDLRRRRRRADRSGITDRRRHGGVGIRSGVLLPDGRGPGGRGRRGGPDRDRWPPIWWRRPWRDRRRCCWSASMPRSRRGRGDGHRRWTPRRPSCARRSPRRAAPPPLVCGNSRGAVCGRPWPTPSRPRKHALSS